MCIDGGGGSQTTVSKTEVPEEVKPYLGQFMNQANSVSQLPYQQYGGQRVAGFSDPTKQGFSAVQQAAGLGSMDSMAARSNLWGTLGGNYLQGSGATNPYMGQNNPYLADAIKNAQSDTVNAYRTATSPQTDSNFARAGAFGGSAWQQAVDNNQRTLGNALARQSTDMRMSDYGQQMGLAENQANRTENAFQNERGRMMSAMSGAGQLQQNDLAGAKALLGIGDMQNQQTQANLDTAYNDWLGQVNQPYRSLDVLGNAIGRISGAGGTNTTTSPTPQSNPLSSALGLASLFLL